MKKLLFIILLCCISCTKHNKVETIVKYQTDTVIVYDTVYQYITDIDTKKELISTQQELSDTKDSLLLYKLKIERIRYYNQVASKGNNIKFLRGWINRVIN